MQQEEFKCLLLWFLNKLYTAVGKYFRKMYTQQQLKLYISANFNKFLFQYWYPIIFIGHQSKWY